MGASAPPETMPHSSSIGVLRSLPVLLAVMLLGLLTWLLPNPQAAQGVALFPGRTMVQPGMLLYVYMGAALVIALMSLLLWAWLKDRLYMHFAALVIVGLLYTALRYQPNGLPLPSGPLADRMLGIIYCCYCIVATTFFSQLFEYRRNWIWAARLFTLVAWFNAAALGVALAGGYAEISRAVVFTALLSTSFGALFVFYLLVVRRLWQYLPGALSFAVPTLLGILSLVGAHGFLPTSMSPDAPVLWFAGRLAGVFLLGVAVANRTRVAERALQLERRLTLERALSAERELEIKVLERTSELLRAQNAIQAALHSEREMRLEQRQFFNMINHEFRTPLAVVDSAATELQDFPSTDLDTLQGQANQIRRACRRLMALADSCLLNDRLDASAFELQLSLASLDELIEEAADLVRWSRRHQLRVDLQHAPEEWECDPTLVRIALSNLVGNAIKYAKAGEIAISARTGASGSLQLSVSDEGPGLTHDAAEQIFERYERGRGTGQTSGYGLGLWVTRRIAKLHGGDVEITSSAKGGACFVLTLGGEVQAC